MLGAPARSLLRLGWCDVRIFVAGVGGVIGVRLVPLRSAAGHLMAAMT
jgi:hypothetical protein